VALWVPAAEAFFGSGGLVRSRRRFDGGFAGDVASNGGRATSRGPSGLCGKRGEGFFS